MGEAKINHTKNLNKNLLKNGFINITELVKLTNLGIPVTDITWARTKMSKEHSICVRHTCVKKKNLKTNNSNKNCLNNNLNGRANFFLNYEDDLSLSYDSKKDFDKMNYEKNETSIHSDQSISSDKSDESITSYQSSQKKISFNSKISKSSNEKANFFLGTNLSVYNSVNNLENNLSLNRNQKKIMVKSNSFNNIIYNYLNNSKTNQDVNYDSNNDLNKNSNKDLTKDSNLSIPNQKTYLATVIYLINPYDARIQKFETEHINFAQLNPIRNYIAIATERSVFIINNRTCNLIASTSFVEKIDYVCWLTPIIIAIITTKTIYHWNLKNNSNIPNIIFYKSPKMYGCQIVNYESDETMSWFALSSLLLEEDGKTIIGLVQIHHENEQKKINGLDINSVDVNNNNCFQQCIEAHCVSFANIKFVENNVDSTTLIAIKKTSNSTIKIYIIELGPLKAENNCLIARTEILRFCDQIQGKIDIPMYNVICLKLGLSYIISKYGQIIICDLQTGTQLTEKEIICQDLIISAKLDIDNQSIICIARNGQVLLIEFNFYLMINQLSNDPKFSKIAKRISFALENVVDEVTRL